MNVILAFGAVLLAAFFYTTLQKSEPSYALLLSLGAALVLLAWILSGMQEVLAEISHLLGQAGDSAFHCLLRSMGLILLTDYTRTLCEEAGADSLGWCVGFAGRCLVLAAAWPLLEEVLQKIGSLTG